MSSNMNIRLRTSSASVGVERLEALDDLPLGGAVGAVDDVDQRVERRRPATSRWAGAPSDSLRSRVASTARMISGEVRSMTAIRCATSACCSGGRPDSTQRRLVGGHVGEHQRDHLRVLVGDERAQLRAGRPGAGTGTASATAAALSRSMISAARSGPSDCSSSCWAKLRPPWAMLARAVDMLAELGQDASRSPSALDRLEAGDLRGDRLDLGLGQVAEHRRGVLAAELDQQDGGLADAAMVGDGGRSSRRSTSQPRSSAATSSGCRSTRAAISSRSSSVGVARRAPGR